MGSYDENPSAGVGAPLDVAEMNAQIAKVEAVVEGLRHSQNLTLAAVVGVGAIIGALMIYGFTRTDQLAERIAAIPGQVAAENRDIIKTLSDAITATKQQAPQVVLLPPPATPQQAPPPPIATQPGSFDRSSGTLITVVRFLGDTVVPNEAALDAIAAAAQKLKDVPAVAVVSSAAISPAMSTQRAIGVANYLVERGYRGRLEISTAAGVGVDTVEIYSLSARGNPK
jgi:outer membrane protein OmpA-like peptidoglycan-associated protein